MVDHLQTLTAQHEAMVIEQRTLRTTLATLQQRAERHENHVRRHNLLFFGIPPRGGGGGGAATGRETHEELEAKVRRVIRDEMGVRKGVRLDQARRLVGPGRRGDSSSSSSGGSGGVAVVARFPTLRDKLRVLSHARNLRGKQFRVSEDFSPRVREVRRGLAPLRDSYRDQGKRAVLRFDKLVTDFDVFTYDPRTRSVRKVDPRGTTPGSGRHPQLPALNPPAAGSGSRMYSTSSSSSGTESSE